MNKKYTDEQIEFLRNNVKGTPYKKLTEMFNKEFGTKFNVRTIAGILKHYKFRNEIDPKFKKGHKNTSPSTFKKGHTPFNARPLLSERVNAQGYLEIKVKEPKTWIHKQVYVWEKENNRKLPKGYVVMFLDGNRLNCDIDNLILVHRRELLCLNRNQMLKKDKANNECCLNYVRLNQKIKEIEKNVCNRL